MLGPTVSAISAIGFILGVVQNMLARWTQRQIGASRDFRAALCPLLYRRTNRLPLHCWQPSKARHLLFAHQSQKQVIGVNRWGAECARFIARKEDDAEGSLCKSFEHKFV